MKNAIVVACILLAVCSSAFSVNLNNVKKPRQFVRAMNTVNKECNAINVRAMKTLMATDPSQVNLAETQAKLDELLDDVEKLEHILAKLKLGPRQRKGLTKKLGNLKQKIQMKIDSLNSMTENAGCFGQKSVFNSHLTKAENTFNSLLEQFDKLTEECKVFSKVCVGKFTHIKEKFTKLNSNVVQPIKGKVDELKKNGCFVSQNDRAAYNKKMLDIECRVEGMIIFVQSSLKNLLEAELNAVDTIKTTLEGLLNANASMQTTVAGEKIETRDIHLKIKDIFHQSIVLKKRFIIVYDCIYEIRGWIAAEDYEHLHIRSTDMYWGLGQLCVNIDEALGIWSQLEKKECFTDDVENKMAEVTALENSINTVFDDVGGQANMVCGDILVTARTKTDELKVKLQVCSNEVNRLLATVNKEMNEGEDRDTIVSSIGNIKMNLETHTKTAEKNHYFLRIFDHLYCLDD